ncbi:MAG: VWA domain-containing protein, partial [Thermoanaerobaculia bacterium]
MGRRCYQPRRGRVAGPGGRLLASILTVRRLYALLALLLYAGSAAAPARPAEEADLPPRYLQWLELVDLLLTKDERRSFLELTEDYQRDAFIESFWRVRDAYPETARNEFKERWLDLAEEARARFGSLDDDRSKILLLNGPPDALIAISCVDLWPAQVWYYERPRNLGTSIALLFYSRFGSGRWYLWLGDDVSELFRFPDPTKTTYQAVSELVCSESGEDAVQAAISQARNAGLLAYPLLLAELQEKPEGPSGEWVNTFRAYSTELPAGTDTFTAELAVQYPGRRQNRTIVQALVEVPRSEVGLASLAGASSYNLVATGEVLLDDTLFENFRYRFNLSEDEIVGDTIPLVIERALRPGDYRLLLRLEDLNSKKQQRLESNLTVPQVEHAAPAPPPADEETRRLLAEAEAALAATDTTIQIVPPRGELITGLVRIDVLTTGREIDHVTFALDEEQVLTKREPPFSVELDFGNTPQLRTLAATARDATGRELARDLLDLNSSPHRFDVQLVEPRRGGRYAGVVRAEADVQVPADQAVDRVEFYLNDTLVATLYQPPWTQQIRLPGADTVAYVSARAVQPDGNSVEDLVFVNAPESLDEIDVQFVELYIAVLDSARRPVLHLPAAEFSVVEDGAPQEPMRFDEVANLPIHAGVLLDVSASMLDRLESAKQAALGFFEAAITPRDRAALITFNDHPNLAVKFTNEVRRLAGGLAGLQAERGTALYDSVVFALHYFNGIKGQRALVLLSDGEDEHSRFAYEDALEYARRAGVAVYAIGLGLERSEARRKLGRFAEETGGRVFLLDDASQLSAAYAEIQRELRSRYYLAYQSTNISGDDAFRTVEVHLARRGLEAKTLRGYYPLQAPRSRWRILQGREPCGDPGDSSTLFRF